MCSYSEKESLIFHVTCNLQMNQPDFWKPLARRGTLFSSFYWSISLRRSIINRLPSFRKFQAISGDKNLLTNLQVTLLRMPAAHVLHCLSSRSSIHQVYSAAPRYLRWTSSGRDNTQTRKYTRTHTRTSPFCERCTFVLTVTSSEGANPDLIAVTHCARPVRNGAWIFALCCGRSISTLCWKAWLGVIGTGLIFHIHF